ncbi:MAG TPA: D-xylose ABC transporter ATP-binding protein, partial [Galbitalea sp.]|nr:D-xylose ABC transporter ATP-binding protein [Galbitalea sp.]
VLARALRCEPKVLVIDEPVQGVDVGAKLAIFRLIADAAARGLAVLIASSDPDDLASICHRVLVMREGLLSAELSGTSKTPDHISETLLASAQSPLPNERP